VNSRIPLRTRLPVGGTGLADHDARLNDVDHLAAVGRRGPGNTPQKQTERAYNRWLRIYRDWCRERGYQTDLALSLRDETAEEFVQWLVVDNDERARYAPHSVRQALSALAYWAAKVAVHPQPSLRAARGVYLNYADELRKKGVVASRSDARILPGEPVG
jgi:hypothetical protein